MVLERFDRNNDGQARARERRQAVRALRRMARQLDREDRRQAKDAEAHAPLRHEPRRQPRPGEVPPNVANKLRPFDRNGDGWVDPGELPR